MTAYNIVRMRVKPGREKEFLDLHRNDSTGMTARLLKNGFRKGAIVRTGDRSYCFVGEWDSFDSIVKSRDDMIGNLNAMRDMLEDLGNGLGVTDPISGEAIVELGKPGR
jgi:hypothetical protein